MTIEVSAEMISQFDVTFREWVPHNKWLGAVLTSATLQPAAVVMSLPPDPRLIGNPANGALHGGVITTLIDAAGGAAVYLHLGAPIPIATLDLRVDFLKPSTPGQPLFTRAECFKATKNVAFVRAVAYHEHLDDPIASAAATYMLSTKGQPVTP